MSYFTKKNRYVTAKNIGQFFNSSTFAKIGIDKLDSAIRPPKRYSNACNTQALSKKILKKTFVAAIETISFTHKTQYSFTGTFWNIKRPLIK